MDLKEIERVVTKIQGRLFKNSNSYSIGMLKSHFRGSGLQFKEHQIYCHGDDVRFIDWKLYAKNNTPYIKTFEEERDIEIIVFLDLSLTMLIGYKGLSKIKAVVNIACLLSLLAKETNDYVRFVLLGEKEEVLPKANGRKAIVLLVEELRKRNVMKNDGEINLSYRPRNIMSARGVSRAVRRFINQRKEVVFLSDFNDLLDSRDLRNLTTSKKAHFFRIIGPLDKGEVRGFSVYGFDVSRDSVENSATVLLNSKNSGEASRQGLPLRVRDIDIDSDYMENFIRGLI